MKSQKKLYFVISCIAVGLIVVCMFLWTNNEKYRSFLSWVNCGDIEVVWDLAENSEKKNDRNHLPIVKIENLDELNMFVASVKQEFNLSSGFGSYKSFEDVCKNFTQEFFEKYSVLIICIISSSGSIKYSLYDIDFTDGITVLVEEKIPSMVSCDMAGWFLSVTVEKSSVHSYDAVLK